MKMSDRVVMLYAVGFAGAGAVSFYRGKRGNEMFSDVVIYGLVAGTALNVASLLVYEDADFEALTNPMPNPFAVLNRATDMGKMSKRAVNLLKGVDPKLYENFKENGVKVDSIPRNPSVVNQDLN